jgi:acyl dehydratase
MLLFHKETCRFVRFYGVGATVKFRVEYLGGRIRESEGSVEEFGITWRTSRTLSGPIPLPDP